MFRLTEIKDKFGNMLFQQGKNIFLYLRDKQETRKLWTISDENELFISRNNKHIFRKLDAYGFNYNLMRILNPKMKIVVKQEDGSRLCTDVETILTAGDCKQFAQEWFELQVFLPRNLFAKQTI